jgi:S-DNA-T family DNA segregation ATPase FtsK/SpoIIIE
MPHLLVAGATGAGKSVSLQCMITSILYKATREQVQFIFIDPKRIELGVYSDIPHLKTEVVVEPKKAANALRWAVAEMERRYRLLAELHVRSIAYYNRAIGDPEVQKRLALREDESEIDASELQPLPYYVIVIDELADLMMVAAAEVEGSIARLAQMARAVGIHLIVATQRPSVDVLTGTIKANFPCRIAFRVASKVDSRTILDQNGAEALLGKGDMLFLEPGKSEPMRLQGAYISTEESEKILERYRHWKAERDQRGVVYSTESNILDEVPDTEAGEGGGEGAADGSERDPQFKDAAIACVQNQGGSTSLLQRKLGIGYGRAARIMDQLEEAGILGPADGPRGREVLVGMEELEEY